MLKHSALPFPLISGGIAYSVTKPNATLLSRHQSEGMKILNISFPREGIKPTSYRDYSHTFVPLHHEWPLQFYYTKITVSNLIEPLYREQTEY